MKSKTKGLPHIYALVFIFMVIMALLTWVLPSGQYTRKDVTIGSSTKSVPVDGTYAQMDKIGEDGKDVRQGLFGLFVAPTEGVQKSADVVAFVLIVGGAFQIINSTGAIMTGMKAIVRKLGKFNILVIPISMILFGLGGTTFGMAEELLPFYMIFIPLLFSMGYDSMTTFLVVFLGSSVGVMASTVNPFSVIIAQGIAGIVGNPQLGFRCVQFIILEALAILFTVLYARRVKKNPESSITFATDMEWKKELVEQDAGKTDGTMTNRQKLVIVIFTVCFIIIIYNLVVNGWYMDEMCAVFLMMGIFSGIAGGLSMNEMACEFVNGMKDFVYAGLIIGISRGILCIAENGMIIDTILYSLVSVLRSVPLWFYTTAMYLVEVVFSIFVPTTSGVAALTMPVLAPLTEFLGFNPEGAVTCYQYACKLTLMLSPAAPVTVAGIAMCRLTFQQWWKTIWKFVLLMLAVTIGFAIISSRLPM
ncbi:YfcC family protein [Paratissierella segnis]|jgi:uncharacterized ion transporter superfamily protein YfcC|uniref:YfcC family protein n=1 Tax=Paratissierella segnis TaxID=2763679 RepID=A0A926ETM6_9FIRM|nr:hypothetical protein [Paratissierella segnis]MBC8588671.1 YfcC family protein [Paratissierella segnis]